MRDKVSERIGSFRFWYGAVFVVRCEVILILRLEGRRLCVGLERGFGWDLVGFVVLVDVKWDGFNWVKE